MAKVNTAAGASWWSLWRMVPRRPRYSRALTFIVVAGFLVAPYCVAQTEGPTESQVKAAYLYNFGKFVTWPADRAAKSDVFEICIVGKDPFGSVLDATVSGESIDGKKVVVRRVLKVQSTGGCNILFISTSEEKNLPAILVEAQKIRALTVSDMPHFAERGGTIGLVNEEGRVRFEVNRKMAEQSHLALSSELLKVALKVIQDKRSGS